MNLAVVVRRLCCRATGEMPVDQLNRLGQEQSSPGGDAGLAPDRIDESRAQRFQGDALPTREQERPDQTHLGGADIRIVPQHVAVLGDRPGEGHEPRDLQGDRRFVRLAHVLPAPIESLRHCRAPLMTGPLHAWCHLHYLIFLTVAPSHTSANGAARTHLTTSRLTTRILTTPPPGTPGA